MQVSIVDFLDVAYRTHFGLSNHPSSLGFKYVSIKKSLLSQSLEVGTSA